MAEVKKDPEQHDVVSTFWQRADQAAAEDKIEEARGWMEGVVELDGENAEAWIRLAGLVPDARERMQCYARALQLDPGNKEAKQGLRRTRRQI